MDTSISGSVLLGFDGCIVALPCLFPVLYRHGLRLLCFSVFYKTSINLKMKYWKWRYTWDTVTLLSVHIVWCQVCCQLFPTWVCNIKTWMCCIAVTLRLSSSIIRIKNVTQGLVRIVSKGNVVAREGLCFPLVVLLCVGCLVAVCGWLSFCCVIESHPQEIAEGLLLFLKAYCNLLKCRLNYTVSILWTAIYCVCLSLSWQSPVSVPHRIRSISRSTREGKTLSEINCEFTQVHNNNNKSILSQTTDTPSDSLHKRRISWCSPLFLPHTLSLTLSFSVGQVKFDPPLRKETEPHHEPVSFYLWRMCVSVCVGAGEWAHVRVVVNTSTSMADPHLLTGSTLCCCQSVSN